LANPERLRAYLTYFERLALQPFNRWEGFSLQRLETRSFGLRAQLAFPCYALGAIALHPTTSPAERERCLKAMAALIDRMLQRRVWAYWAISAEVRQNVVNPIARGNGEFSGHLAMMLGMYEIVGGDNRYDTEPFQLLWSHNSFDRFSFTHTSLVNTLWEQAKTSKQLAVLCKPCQVRASQMNHILWAFALHDALHGSEYAAGNEAWFNFLQRRLALWGPNFPGRGTLNALYWPCLNLTPSLSLNFEDAWALAFLAQLQPDLTRDLAQRFFSQIRYLKEEKLGDPLFAIPQAYLPSLPFWQKLEIAEEAVTTGFAYLLAVELGEEMLASFLLSYADQQLQPIEQQVVGEGERFYNRSLAPPFATALYALGEAGGLKRIAERMQLKVTESTNQRATVAEARMPLFRAIRASETPSRSPRL